MPCFALIWQLSAVIQQAIADQARPAGASEPNRHSAHTVTPRRSWTRVGTGASVVRIFLPTGECPMRHDAQPRQLTFRAVVLAIVLAVVLSAANAYLGLFAGLTIATAIPAAVVSMGVLRLLGGGTILEKQHRADRRFGRVVDRRRCDLHHSGAGDHGLLAGLQVLVGAGHCRHGRAAGRAVLGTVAALDDRRRPAAVPRRQGGGRSAQGRRKSRPGPEDPGRFRRHRRAGQAGCGQRFCA